jgi:hypothetical protein
VNIGAARADFSPVSPVASVLQSFFNGGKGTRERAVA